MAWTVKISHAVDENPKVLDAGYHGRAVLMWALCLSVRKGFAGSIPADYARDGHIARALSCPVEWASEGVAGCLRAGILRRGGDGGLEILPDPDWDQPLSDAERKRIERNKKKEQEAAVTVGHAASAGVTDGHARSVDGHAVSAMSPSGSDRSGPFRTDPKEEIPPNPPEGGVLPGLVDEKRDRAEVETGAFVEWFNRKFGKRCQAGPYVTQVRAILKAHPKTSQEDFRLVALYARAEWAGGPLQARLIPETLLRLQPFPRRLDIARQWREDGMPELRPAKTDAPRTEPRPAPRSERTSTSGQAVPIGALVGRQLGGGR